ncbi:MAG: WYL domain-containing protein [Bacteroidetes bacterium]|nr:MAG: WYL domain-containing protein [Bacteroidota bacterium]
MSAPEKEYGTKDRLLRILLALVENPFGYTRKQLAVRYGVDRDTIKNDFNCFRNAGLVLQKDDKHRYRLVLDKPYKQLKHLLHFSEEDQQLLEQAIDQISPHTKSGDRLKKKLASLYDYQKLGHYYLRKPYLKKVDTLLLAKEQEKAVLLKDYRSSNSNRIEDRKVEPFHVSPPDDTLQAFDLDKKQIRHFRISRIKRVEMLGEAWQFTGHHAVMLTDPFRIVDNEQVLVHLRLKVGAYNELVERYPITKAYIEETEESEVYDFQCMVNHRFLGLSNFILGYHHQIIEIVEPESLKEHLASIVKKMNF